MTVLVGDSVAFSGANSTDLEGDALTYTWDFGDGTKATGDNVTHAFDTAGTYNVTLTVDDSEYNDTDTVTITVDPLAPTANLIHHWTLDEVSGTVANDEVGALNGTVYGSPDRIPGKVDGAYEFDGSTTYIDFGSYSGTDTTYSIALWMKTTGDGTTFHRGDGEHCEYNPRLFGDRYSETGCGGENMGSFVTTVNDGSWHHVVVVRDGNTLTAYVDGDYDSELTGSFGSASGRFYIGTAYNPWKGTQTDHFLGAIDDVREYDAVLSASEVNDLYKATD